MTEDAGIEYLSRCARLQRSVATAPAERVQSLACRPAETFLIIASMLAADYPGSFLAGDPATRPVRGPALAAERGAGEGRDRVQQVDRGSGLDPQRHAAVCRNSGEQYRPVGSWAGCKVFMHPSGYKGTEPFKGPEPGSNGMTLDADGRVSVAGHAGRTVWRMESVDPHAQITVLADSYQGKKLNSPNDLVYKSDGSLYFTDPPYGLPTQSDSDPAEGIAGQRRIPGARCAPAESRVLRPSGTSCS